MFTPERLGRSMLRPYQEGFVSIEIYWTTMRRNFFFPTRIS